MELEEEFAALAAPTKTRCTTCAALEDMDTALRLFVETKLEDTEADGTHIAVFMAAKGYEVGPRSVQRHRRGHPVKVRQR